MRKRKGRGILSYVSYIFRPNVNCYISVYGGTSEKTIAICDGQTEAISLVFSKITCKLLKEYIENLQAILEEIDSD